MELPSTKPYLLRAIWEWCCDNGFTPHIAVEVDERTRVPREFVRSGQIVLNLGPSAVTSAAGAHAVGELVKPASVIATHVNEGATTDGKVRPASRTAAFAGMVKGRPVYLALSGRTMEFDGDGRCTSGCAQP